MSIIFVVKRIAMKRVYTILVVLILISCQKENVEPEPQQPATNTGNNNTSSNVNNYIWVSLATYQELNNLDSLSYDDGTGNIIMLDSTTAQGLFIPNGGGYYTNIEINGPVGYEVDVCIYMKPKPPVGFGFFNYYTDVRLMTSPQSNYGSSGLIGTDDYTCETNEIWE